MALGERRWLVLRTHNSRRISKRLSTRTDTGGKRPVRGINMTDRFDHASRVHEYTRLTLSAIRLFNGTAALFAPAALLRRLGVNPETNPAALYALRMFGVRTVLIGAQLLLRNSGLRAHSLRVAPVIHVLDAAAAMIAGAQGQLPPRAATTAALISTVNTVLAVVAQTHKVEEACSPGKPKNIVKMIARAARRGA